MRVTCFVVFVDFFFYCYPDHRDLHSFPTRRSSDLLPVPAHRRAWTGGANVLVATAIGDHDVPVAFDVHGNRRLLDPEHPPATPVIAVVPVETDFSPKPSALIACVEYCGGGGRGRARAPAR